MATWSPCYPPTYSTDYVKATTYYDVTRAPWLAINPTLSLTGGAGGTSWQSSLGQTGSQKFNIDLNSAKIIRRLRIDNYHSSGYSTEIGIKDCYLYGTNSSTAFLNTTYSDTTNLTLLGSFTVSAHIGTNTADPQYFDFDNTIAYQYYVIRIANNHGGTTYIGVRFIQFLEDLDYGASSSSGGSSGSSSTPGFIILNQLVDLVYSCKTNQLVNLIYRDFYYYKQIVNIRYEDTVLLKRLIQLCYDDMAKFKTIVNIPYNIQESLKQLINIKYHITEEELNNIINLNYDLQLRDEFKNIVNLIYAISPGGSNLTTMNFSVALNSGATLDPFHCNIERDIGLGNIEIEIQTKFLDDYNLCQPLPDNITYLTVTMMTDVYNVIVEKRSDRRSRGIGNNEAEVSYIINLVSPVVLLQENYASSISEELYGMASNIVEYLVGLETELTVDWEIVDWYIPRNVFFVEDSSPYDAILELLESVNAVLISKKDGNLVVVYNLPDFWDIENASIDHILTEEDHVQEVIGEEITGRGYNNFLITNEEIDTNSLKLQTESVNTTTATIKVWEIPYLGSNIQLRTSGGNWINITNSGITLELIEDELVEIVDGEGTISNPVTSISRYSWEYSDLGDLEFSESSEDIGVVLEDGTIKTTVNGQSLLRISYYTRYFQFTAIDPNIETVQFYPEIIE